MHRTTGAIALGLLLVGACDRSTNEAAPAEAEATPTKDAPDAAKAEPDSKPVELPPLPPAPEGTVAIDRTWVHTCAEPHPCPALLQDAGEAHCAGLSLGGRTWRLPTLEELQAWRGRTELAGYDVFHWSGSSWDEDPGQYWIYDPGSDAKTTAKPDRKPFTIRCVAEPAT